MRLYGLMALAACGAGADLPAEQLPLPVVPALNVSATAFVPGTTAEVFVTGAQPGQRVFLAYSPNGQGTSVCPPSWGGACAGLDTPVSVVSTANADNLGEAVFSIPLPNRLPFNEAWLQAAVPGAPPTLSRPFSVDVEPLPTPWDGVMPRPEGPHDLEHGLTLAWEIATPTRPATINTSYGAQCNPTAPNWGSVFAPPTYNGGFYYVFYEYSSDGLTAEHQNCALGYPDACFATVASNESPVLGIVDNRLSYTFQPLDVFGGGCQVSRLITWEVIDNGMTGEFNIHVDLEVADSCPSRVNDGCSFTHTIDLEYYDLR